MTGPASVRLRVRGTVQGVGYRPFVYRLARQMNLAGWVRNDAEGVEIEVSGNEEVIARFAAALASQAPPVARVTSVEVTAEAPSPQTGKGEATATDSFLILESPTGREPTTLISPDLPVCDDCLGEMRDPSDRRYGYAFVNCTNCGPRYSIIESLPYDRPRTTMRAFPLCPDCEREYHDPHDRRFHAQPVACPECGPQLRYLDAAGSETARGGSVVALAAAALREGRILAIKGIGGYHLACDAYNLAAVSELRHRKYRKEKPFALMARDLAAAEELVVLGPVAEGLLRSPARPIVLAPARHLRPPDEDLARLPAAHLHYQGRTPLSLGLPDEGEVPAARRLTAELMEALAPENDDLGVMLPYTPLQHLLFDAGAPEALVMTSANRSSEPIAYRDDEAIERLAGLADAFVVGEREIARRIDDSVATAVAGRPVLVRRSRGYAPAPVAASAKFRTPILALGADLKNSITLATGGQAFVSQHIGDLEKLESLLAFRETIADLSAMYRVDLSDALLAHDPHPAYFSSREAEAIPGERIAVQHHRAHVASVLAERDCWEDEVLGFAFDGTGYGDDGSIWGGECFRGSLRDGLERVAHLRPAGLPGGDAAARNPVQAAVGFLAGLDGALERVVEAPFNFPAERVRLAAALIRSGRAPATTSLGRLFDAVSALTGFTRGMTFEGQAAIRLEALARQAEPDHAYRLPFDGRQWDYRPLLAAVLNDVEARVPAAVIARRFHEGLAEAVLNASLALGSGTRAVVLSGGVFQNRLLTEATLHRLRRHGLEAWINERVPANDGGISLGQAAIAATRG